MAKKAAKAAKKASAKQEEPLELSGDNEDSKPGPTFTERIDRMVADLEALKPTEKDTHQIMQAIHGLNRLRGVFEYLDK